MSATNKTPNYDLPLYVANDKPTYLGDWNSTMSKLDSAIDAARESGGETAEMLSSMGVTTDEEAAEFGQKVADAQNAEQVQGIIDTNTAGFQNAEQVQGIIDTNTNGFVTADGISGAVADYTNSFVLENILGYEEEGPSTGMRGVECVYNICNSSYTKTDGATAFYNIPEMYSVPNSSSMSRWYGYGVLAGNVNIANDYALDKLPKDGNSRLVYAANVLRVFGASTAYDIKWETDGYQYIASPQAADKRFTYNVNITPTAITKDNYEDFIAPQSPYAAAIGFACDPGNPLIAWTDGWNSSVVTTSGYAQSSKMAHLVYHHDTSKSMAHAYYTTENNDPNATSRSSYSIEGIAKWIANYTVNSATLEREVDVSCSVELLYGYLNTFVNPSGRAQSKLYFGGDCNLAGAENAFLNWCRVNQTSTVKLNYFYLKGCEFNDEVTVQLQA